MWQVFCLCLAAVPCVVGEVAPQVNEGILAFYPSQFQLKNSARAANASIAVTIRNLSDKQERLFFWLNDTFNNVRYDLWKAGLDPEWEPGANPGRYMPWQDANHTKTAPAMGQIIRPGASDAAFGDAAFGDAGFGIAGAGKPGRIRAPDERLKPVPRGVRNEAWADSKKGELPDRAILVLDNDRTEMGPATCGEVIRTRISLGPLKPMPWQRKIECAPGVIRLDDPNCQINAETFIEGHSILVTPLRGFKCDDFAIRQYVSQLAEHVPIKGISYDTLRSNKDIVEPLIAPMPPQDIPPPEPSPQAAGTWWQRRRESLLPHFFGGGASLAGGPSLSASNLAGENVGVAGENAGVAVPDAPVPFSEIPPPPPAPPIGAYGGSGIESWNLSDPTAPTSQFQTEGYGRQLLVARDGNVTTHRSFDSKVPVNEYFFGINQYGNGQKMMEVFENYDLLSQYPREASPIVMVVDQFVNLTHPEVYPGWAVNKVEEKGKPGTDDDADGWIDNIRIMDGFNDVGDYTPDGTHASAGHGHEVSGIIIAVPNNKIGTAGVAPNLRVLPCGAGGANLSTGATVRCIQYAINQAKRLGIRIINNSYSGTGRIAGEEKVLKEASEAGLILTCSTGNEQMDFDSGDWPMTYPWGHLWESRIYGIIPTPMTDALGNYLACGYSRSWNYFMAPGQLLLTSQTDFNTLWGKGTSFSAPAVAGIIGAMLTVNPALNVFDVLWILENSLTLKDEYLKYVRWGGMPSMKRAIQAAQGNWLKPLPAQDTLLYPGEERSFEFSASIPKAYAFPQLKGNLVIYREDKATLTGYSKVGEVPVTIEL